MQKAVEKMTEGATLERYKTTASVIIASVKTASRLTIVNIIGVIR